jgi:L-aspartate oxidase
MIQTNYLIIGSGVAGLTFALKIAEQFPDKKVTIVTKANADESNTKYAQGGIAIVTDKIVDSYEKHIEDTLICGDGLCNEEVVKMVITEGPKRLKELIEWGAKFDKNVGGTLNLGKEGGHSENRVVHHKDQTGQEIQRAILSQVHQKENIKVLDYHLAIDLITENNRCLGAYVLNEKTNFACYWRNWTYLWTHHESRDCHWRWNCNGLSSQSSGQRNGIYSISPNRFI